MRSRSLLLQLLAVNALLVAVVAVTATVAPGAQVVLAVIAVMLANGFILHRRLEAARAAERARAAHAVLRGQEAERARVARDLHDEVNQALTAVLLRVEAARRNAPAELDDELAEVQALTGRAMDELLRLARELRPSALDDHGLAAALRTQVDEFAARTGIDASFAAPAELPALSEDQQLVAYRVVQESLSNVARHAEASHVTVEWTPAGVRVADDGRGGASEGGGTGLRGMRERALQVGARLRVRSAAGDGTSVELRFA